MQKTALQATFHIHVILLPIGIQKICLVPFRIHHLGWCFFTGYVLHELLQVRLHRTMYFDMVKICYTISDCALCHSDDVDQLMCWFGVFVASASHYHFVHVEYTGVLYKACFIHL